MKNADRRGLVVLKAAVFAGFGSQGQPAPSCQRSCAQSEYGLCALEFGIESAKRFKTGQRVKIRCFEQGGEGYIELLSVLLCSLLLVCR